jgi:membrane dipeptidase
MDWGYDDGALTAILGGNLMQLMKTIEGARSHV